MKGTDISNIYRATYQPWARRGNTYFAVYN